MDNNNKNQESYSLGTVYNSVVLQRQKDKERLLEGVTTKKVRYGSSLEDVDKGYNQALEDIKQLIKEIYE